MRIIPRSSLSSGWLCRSAPGASPNTSSVSGGAADELKKRAYISNYVGPIAEALDEILKLPEGETSAIEGHLEAIITETRGGDIKA